MEAKNHKPVQVSCHLYQLGTPAFPAYLSMGEEGMIIEGGTGATFPMMVSQIKSLGIDIERIKRIVLTHTHPDHIGAVPHFQRACCDAAQSCCSRHCPHGVTSTLAGTSGSNNTPP